MTKAPNSRRNLDEAIRRASGAGNSFISVRTAMANTIVAQMLPNGVVKGGGWDDLYAAQANELDVFLTVDEAISWANGLVEEISNYSHINKLIDD